MFEKSIIGSMPWLNRFRPSVTRQTLPVRSPLPNRQPSTRSAPASTASSASATAVPRSLWVCTDRHTCSRRDRLRLIHSIWSAYTFGVDRSTVHGRLRMISRPGPWLPDVHDRLAGLQREVQLGVHEDLWRVLVAEVGAVAEDLLRVLHDVPGAVDRERLALLAADAEHHLAERRRGRVVQVHGRPRGAFQGLHRALDQVLARLGEHRDAHVLRDLVALDELAHEVEVGLARAREADLDLLVAHRDQQVEHGALAVRATSGRSAPGCRPAGRWRASAAPS